MPTMVQTPTGDKKKNLILNTFKKLFYEKGYHKTTYEDVCRTADIPPGSITYHLKGKKNVAALIHSEYEVLGKQLISNITGDVYDLRIMSALKIIHWWDRVFEDPNIRRFLMEIAEEQIPRSSIFNTLESFYLLQIQEYNLNINEKKLKFIVSSHLGLVDQLLLYICKDMSKYSFKEVANHVIECYYKFLDTDRDLISQIIKESDSIYDTLPIDNRYFQYFRYKYPDC